MKPELPVENQIEEAIKDVQDAMLENIKASKLIVDITKKKEAARFKLLKAKERLTGLERSLME